MRLVCALLFFISLVLGAGEGNAHSGRTHIAEKIYFYFNYKIEGLIGGERTFAPDCENCDYSKFVDHIIKNEGTKVNFAEPGTDLKGIRKSVQQVVTSKHRTKGQAWVNVRALMPSVPSSTVDDQEYTELYNRSNQWVKDVQEKIEKISDSNKKKEAENLFKSAKICVEEMKAMRRAGFLYTEYEDANKKFGQQEYKSPNGDNKKGVVEGKDIKPDKNGGQTKYKEIDLVKTENKGLKNLLTDVNLVEDIRGWQAERNVNDKNTKRHRAVDTVVGQLQKCYP